jgi:hypothetical protein
MNINELLKIPDFDAEKKYGKRLEFVKQEAINKFKYFIIGKPKQGKTKTNYYIYMSKECKILLLKVEHKQCLCVMKAFYMKYKETGFSSTFRMLSQDVHDYMLRCGGPNYPARSKSIKIVLGSFIKSSHARASVSGHTLIYYKPLYAGFLVLNYFRLIEEKYGTIDKDEEIDSDKKEEEEDTEEEDDEDVDEV